MIDVHLALLKKHLPERIKGLEIDMAVTVPDHSSLESHAELRGLDCIGSIHTRE